jgi:hypothetical protein
MTAVNKAWQRERFVEGVSFKFFFPTRDVGIY